MWKPWALLVLGGVSLICNGVTGRTCTYVAGKLSGCDSKADLIMTGVLAVGIGGWRLWAAWRRESQPANESGRLSNE
jgi:hypothetical protein